MKFAELAERAARDQSFFNEIQAAANRAAAEGVGSEAWITLANYFAEDETELSLLIPPVGNVALGVLDTTTETTTLLTTQTGMTGTTTTTTTTSRLCTIPGICPQAEASPTAADAAQIASEQDRP
jgi:hypothetical protein